MSMLDNNDLSPLVLSTALLTTLDESLSILPTQPLQPTHERKLDRHDLSTCPPHHLLT